jgi:hypothetical protein
MSSVRLDPASDEWRSLVDALGRLHRQLLVKARELQARLSQAGEASAVAVDVQGYLAESRPVQLGMAERAELVQELRVQVRVLERLTAELNDLQALGQPPARTARVDDS